MAGGNPGRQDFCAQLGMPGWAQNLCPPRLADPNLPPPPQNTRKWAKKSCLWTRSEPCPQPLTPAPDREAVLRASRLRNEKDAYFFLESWRQVPFWRETNGGKTNLGFPAKNASYLPRGRKTDSFWRETSATWKYYAMTYSNI